MPILKEEIKTREIVLPVSGAKLTILDNVSYGKMVEIRSLPSDNVSSTLPAIAALIVDWDFTDENQVKLPINADNVKKLDREDGDFLLEEVSKNFNQKKTSVSK